MEDVLLLVAKEKEKFTWRGLEKGNSHNYCHLERSGIMILANL